MRRSFYHYLMTLRTPQKTAESQFAEHVAKDNQFPKQSENYHELSTYLEMDVDYLPTMFIFDEVWEKYLENSR